jgi:hypothetical protein
MATNEFLPFATAGGANVQPQVDYAASASRTAGFSAGIAPSAEVNKAIRQAAFMASVLAQFTANITGNNVLDDGDVNGKVALLLSAVQGAGGRIRLSADTTFYVSTTGNDSTGTGLTVGSPWLTIQHALDVIQKSYDIAGWTATIQLADGTYTAGGTINGPFYGQGDVGGVVVAGNAGTPANVVISVGAGNCFSATQSGRLGVKNLKMTVTAGGGNCLYAAYSGLIWTEGPVEFAASSGTHIVAEANGTIHIGANYTISGSAPAHWNSQFNGTIFAGGFTITITNTPAFATAFAFTQSVGSMNVATITFVNAAAATGTRYNAQSNGTIYTNGGGANYLPGNVAGVTASGGQYV